jgi:hypothetical protein
MIISQNIFFINMLSKLLILKIPNSGIFSIVTLKKRKRVRLKFKQKNKKKTILITPIQNNTYNFFLIIIKLFNIIEIFTNKLKKKLYIY